MALLTTTVGAYPKPAYIFPPDPARTGGARQDDLHDSDSRFRQAQAAEAEKLLRRASREVVREQVEVGIEVPTTGEIGRDDDLYYVCRHLEGIDFERRGGKVTRLAAEEVEVPTVTGPIALHDHFLRPEWRLAQAATKRPVKITTPGPFTLADALADEYYGDEKALAAGLAEALNQEIRELAEAGCGWIQIDEPLFALEPAKAVAFGIDNLEHCFHRVPEGVVRIAHLCSGFPTGVDDEDYLKAEARAYFELAEPLELSTLQAVSIEDTHRPIDLLLLEQFATTRLILGVIAGARSQIEPVEEITDRLTEALLHIDSQRLMVAPDCGLHLLDRRLVRTKLTQMVIAAGAVG